MAKQKLFPDRPDASDDDTRQPREQFTELATKIFTVPKTEIDKREKQWQRTRQRRRATG